MKHVVIIVKEVVMDYLEYKLEYHEGYFAAGNNIPYSEDKTEAWKEGYRDGKATLYGGDEDDGHN